MLKYSLIVFLDNISAVISPIGIVIGSALGIDESSKNSYKTIYY